MVWVTLCQLKTMHGYFCQEPTRTAPEWKFLSCLEGFQLISATDTSHSSLRMKFLHSIFWSLFSLFPMFSKLRASENEKVPKPVPHYLCIQPMGFSVRKNRYIWASGDISAHFYNAHLALPPSEGQVVCWKPEASGKTSGLVTSTCTCAELCLCAQEFWRSNLTPHTL